MISVSVATYNGEKYIEEQLDSILNNICSDDEIVVSDDGSNDNTLNILNEYRFKYFWSSSLLNPGCASRKSPILAQWWLTFLKGLSSSLVLLGVVAL